MTKLNVVGYNASEFATVAQNDQIVVQKLIDASDYYKDTLFIKNKEYHKEQGVAAILSRPDPESIASSCGEFGVGGKKGVLLLHGHAGHKNYLGYSDLAEALQKNGYYVLRIDFRGLGDSEDNADKEMGRTIQQDLEDIESCYLYFKTVLRVKLDTIVAHSRAVVSMVEFQLKVLQDEKYNDFVPNLINCAGRFDSNGLKDKIMLENPHWNEDNGFSCTTLRYGSLEKIFVPMNESLSAINVDCSAFVKIDPRCFVLSVYGSQDSVIPLSAGVQYGKVFENRHQLEIVDYADHNFYGLEGDLNRKKLPLKRGKVNYTLVLHDLISKFLTTSAQLAKFHETTKTIYMADLNTYRSRWPLPYEFSNILNFRDCGGYKTVEGNKMVKPGVFFRSANLVDISQPGFQFLQNNIHIRKVFDLRSQPECEKWGVIDVTGGDADAEVKINVQSVSFKRDLDPEKIITSFKSMLLGPKHFPQCYMQTLHGSIESLKIFFQYLIDNDLNEFDHSVVFHCAVGKDRTGIMNMVLLKVLGVDNYTISMDYSMTRLGLKLDSIEHTNKLVRNLMERGHEFFAEALGEEEFKMFVDKYGMSPEQMNRNIMSCEFFAMKTFLDIFDEHYGSIDDFFTSHLEFTTKDIDLLKNKYLV